MKKKAQVHMLPTDKEFVEKSQIYANGSHIGIWSHSKEKRYHDFIPQHLYFTIDEEIKEGDWFHLDMSDNMMDEELDDISIFSRFVSFVIRTTIVLGICCIALIFLIINVLTS